jgi:hypothetical protein
VKRERAPKPLLIPSAKQYDTPVALRFSFKYLDLLSNPKFSVNHCHEGYLEKLLCRLRDVCTFSVKDFRTNRTHSLKAHKIEWDETSEHAGFTNLNEQLRDEEAWQFHITTNEHGRVHGILLGDTFYVVWIDPNHLLYQ